MTGATSGVGKELAKLLYSKNATVYLGSRSEARAAVVITEIGVLTIQTRGCLNPLEINLEDLDSVARAAKHFLQRENNLDGLFNNAGIMLPPLAPLDAKTKQGYDLQFGTNTIASFRFTRLLTPIMAKTAKGQDPGGVRVVWVASSAAELLAPKGGIDMNNLDLKKPVTSAVRYAESKAGMALLSQEYARRHKSDGIISVVGLLMHTLCRPTRLIYIQALNPGNLKTDLRRHLSWPAAIVFGWISHEPIKGAYTELFAGFSKEIKLGNSGCWGKLV